MTKNHWWAVIGLGYIVVGFWMSMTGISFLLALFMH